MLLQLTFGGLDISYIPRCPSYYFNQRRFIGHCYILQGTCQYCIGVHKGVQHIDTPLLIWLDYSMEESQSKGDGCILHKHGWSS